MSRKKKNEKRELSPVEFIRERQQLELERRLARVRKKRASYQRKIIGTAVVFFVIMVIICALLPGEDNTAGDNWKKPVSSRQAQVLQSLQDGFK